MATATPLKPVPRQLPTTQAIEEGYQFAICFSNNPSFTMYEMDVQPFGLQVGKALNRTTQANKTVKTKGAPHLIEVTDISGSCTYAPNSLDDAFAQVGKEALITQWWPDGDAHVLFGYLESFLPETAKDEAVPMAKYKIVVTNVDPATGLEVKPSRVAAPSGGYSTIFPTVAGSGANVAGS